MAETVESCGLKIDQIKVDSDDRRNLKGCKVSVSCPKCAAGGLIIQGLIKVSEDDLVIGNNTTPEAYALEKSTRDRVISAAVSEFKTKNCPRFNSGGIS